MSANVDTMFSVRQVPWHREGVILGDYPGSWAEARKAAGLDWDPIASEVFTLHGIDDQGQPIYQAIPGWKNVVRSDTGATLALTKNSYQIIDHGAMGDVIQAILEQDGLKYETAGALSGGVAVWVLVQLDEPIQLPGDNSLTMPYVALTTRHDGMGALTARATAVRIVCANTWRAAEMEGERTGATYSFHHTANWRDRVKEARDAITGARKEIRAYVELATELLGVKVTKRQRELFLREFIPSPPDGVISDRVARNLEEARGALRTIMDSDTTKPVANTAYGLVQAAGEYLDHLRGYRNQDSYLGRTLLKPEPLKTRALKMVRELVAKA